MTLERREGKEEEIRGRRRDEEKEATLKTGAGFFPDRREETEATAVTRWRVGGLREQFLLNVLRGEREKVTENERERGGETPALMDRWSSRG